ncbi:disintegrin and metalloproteinase domain-containing protein 9-like [Ambystoma mexicanum]|uniref:disintegrin and metalloproteinase domain-containing protein 9-like n=1 Tax=Ambystoma mexicanum TaxID=8296 RepID=UPI0037E94815
MTSHRKRPRSSMCGPGQIPRPRRCLCLLCALLLRGALAFETPSFFEISIPKKLEPKADGGPGHKASYAVTVGGRTYILQLRQNRVLLPPALTLYRHRSAGYPEVGPWLVRRDCYYQGFVEGIPGSIVALSICSGLKGFIQTESVIYAIEPASFSSTFQHLIYEVEDMDVDPRSCFTTKPERTYLEKYHYTMHQAKRPRKVAQPHYVELRAILDYDLYSHYAENSTILIETVFQVLNMANSMFAPLNLHLVLLSLEIWEIRNLIPSYSDVDTFLKHFASWKEENSIPHLKVDMTVLFRKNDIQYSVGATYSEEICWGHNAVMFVAFTNLLRRDLPAIATTLTHQLGHTLGMEHDFDYVSQCHCPLGFCIMFLGRVTTTSFSDCSTMDFGNFISSGNAFCLQNVPFDGLRSAVPHCGNKAVEGDEQCDCGSVKECASDRCCDATCKLKGSAQCSRGPCCHACHFVKKGTPCRLPVSECDLAEYCNGTSAVCPPDVYYQDGSTCNRNQSVCVNNKCYDYMKHCRMLFGKGATVASPKCFSVVNTNGDRFGNCGFEGKDVLPKKCEVSDVMCGRVQCENVNGIHIYNSHSAIIQTPVGNSWCWGIGHHYSYDITDFGAVQDGAKCGIGKVCVNRTCVDISVLNYDCNIQKNCSGHGVCNNKKNCHCYKYWAPPDCKHRGHGGSIDSGPLVKGSFVSYVYPKEEEFTFTGHDSKSSAVVRGTDISLILGLLLILSSFAILLHESGQNYVFKNNSSETNDLTVLFAQRRTLERVI